jgi:hypothetical protein
VCTSLPIFPLIVDVELAIENFIEPGAGLLHLPDLLQDSDHLFDSLFLPNVVDIPGTTVSTPMVRTYGSDYAVYDVPFVAFSTKS